MRDLGTLAGGSPSRPMGINNDGAVVGQGDAGTELHAFVWLPAALYGFPCSDLYDLHDLPPGTTPAGDSIGYEINTTGTAARIAGQAGGVNGDAFVWTLAGGTATPLSLSSFVGGGFSTTTAAWAINDASPAVVVGDGVQSAVCIINPFDVHVGFRTTLDGSDVLESLDPYGGDNASFARDIGTASPLKVVGYSDGEDPLGECLGPAECDLQRDAVFWGVPPTPTFLTKINAIAGGAQALGTNDAGDIVGSSYDSDGNDNCVRNATLWRAPGQALVILGDQDPLGVASETVAFAINNNGELQIVGINELTQHALLWEEKAGSGWEPVLDLEDAACDCNDDFILVEALDINDDGWIVARGRSTPGGSDHAYLLRPVADCPADLDGDGHVGTTDFLIFNGSGWPRDCADCNEHCCECLADVNFDCTININDFLKILATWGPCPGFGAPCPQAGAASGSGLSLEQAVQQLGFANVTGLQTWLKDADPDEAYGAVQLLAVLVSE